MTLRCRTNYQVEEMPVGYGETYLPGICNWKGFYQPKEDKIEAVKNCKELPKSSYQETSANLPRID